MEFETSRYFMHARTALLKFTPLEFETRFANLYAYCTRSLKFTPLEFETKSVENVDKTNIQLKFTPLEFETLQKANRSRYASVKIYSVGV